MAAEATPLIMFRFQVGETFSSFDEFSRKVKEFEERSFVKLYKRSSRTIASTLRRAPKKKYNQRLQYTEIDMSCIHGGKNFVSTSTGKRIFYKIVAIARSCKSKKKKKIAFFANNTFVCLYFSLKFCTST